MNARSIAIAGLALLAALPARAQGLWEQPRYAAILMDASDGEILYQRRADLARHPASITKVMTLYLAFDALASGQLNLTDTIAISRHAALQPPSKLGLRIGQTIGVEEAMRVIAVKSANDIAVALAEKIAGNEPAFVAAMNAKAAALGMTNTHFMNASGLPNAHHVTTARDLATLSEAVLANHADRYAYFSTPDYIRAGRITMNHNHLLGQVPGVDGIKTGYTASSGYTLAASAVRGGRRLIAIVLGSPTGFARDANVTQLLEAGFDVLRDRVMGGRRTVAASLGEVEEGAPLLAGGAGPVTMPAPSALRITGGRDTIGDLIAGGWGRNGVVAKGATGLGVGPR